MKKGMFVFGLLLTILAPLAGMPLFFMTGGAGSLLPIGEEYAGIAFIGGIVLTAVLPVIGIFMILGATLIPLFSGMKAKNRILEQGMPAEAKILALNDTGTRINNNPLVQFSLEVRSPIQPAFRVEVSQTVSMIHIASFQPGKLVNVKYLPGTNEVAILGAKL